MSRYYDYLKEKELRILEPVSYEEIVKARETMDEEVFKKRYVDGVDRSKILYKDVPHEDINTYLSYEMLKEQRETRKGIKRIQDILTFFLVLAIVGLLTLFFIVCSTM